MKRTDLEHLVRAAGRVIGAEQIIVVGSQAILATIPEFMLPPEATMSVEADLIPFDGTEGLADEIDGAIGEASAFHETFGVYAHGVGYERSPHPTAGGIASSNTPTTTDGVTGLCLEINDLWLTKLAAGRAKDFEFCRALVRAKLITADIVKSRTSTIDPRIDAAELAARVERLLGEPDSE